QGWVVDVTNVKTRVNNFLDHANVGESNIYFPIAVDGALIRAWELAIRSPQLADACAFGLRSYFAGQELGVTFAHVLLGNTQLPPLDTESFEGTFGRIPQESNTCNAS